MLATLSKFLFVHNFNLLYVSFHSYVLLRGVWFESGCGSACKTCQEKVESFLSCQNIRVTIRAALTCLLQMIKCNATSKFLSYKTLIAHIKWLHMQSVTNARQSYKNGSGRTRRCK